MRLKAIAAAIGLIAVSSNAAYAGTVGDSDLDGSSDVVFQLLNFETNETVSWDLSTGASDLTSSDFYNQGASLTFSLTDTAVSSFIAAADPATLKWRVLGVGQDALAPRNYGGTLTSNTAPAPGTTPGIGLNVASINSFLNNLGSIDTLDNTAKVISAGSLTSWTGVPETVIFADTPKLGFGSLDFYYVHRKPTGSVSAINTSQVDKLGTFALAFNGGVATLSYNIAPVPIPAAAWLFGTAVAGLAGLGRRKTS